MKSFLTIVGVLAVFASVVAFAASKSAVHEILSAISLMIGCTSLGLAKLIELFETHLERTSAMRKREVEHWERAQPAAPAALPPIPGTERWHVAIGAEVKGPLRADEVRALRDKSAIGPESFVISEGWQSWKRLRDCSI